MTNSQVAVPFYSQHWDLDQWKKLGFKDREDAEYWMWSCCGILCLRMSAEHLLQKTLSTTDLIAQGQKLGAYTHERGWTHAGIAELARSLGLEARTGHFTPSELAKALEQGNLAITSIKWGFESRKNLKERVLFWKKYGGHLALALSAQEKNGKLEGFSVHHTSARAQYDWPNRFIPLAKFKKGYTGRAIIISKP